MADFVIDEWLWADVSGENSGNNQKEALALLEAIYQKCDRIVWVKNGAFINKFWPLCSICKDPMLRNIIKMFRANFLFNTLKSYPIEHSELPILSEEIATDVDPNDHYLVQSLKASGASMIITTDGDLIRALDRYRIPCKLRHEFLATYNISRS